MSFFLVMPLCALAQTGLNSSYFQSMTARELGPSTMSGRITAIEGAVSSDQVTIYVGTAGGGIWRSYNGGVTFSPVFDKYCQSIGALAVDRKNPKLVYAGTGESNMRNTVSIGNGIYKTNDGGANWQKLGLDSTEHISKILIDPADDKTLYVAVPGPLWSSSQHRGLYKSSDAGKTWKKILYVNEETGCADIAIHPQNPKIMFASFWQFRRKPYSFASGGPGSALYKSTDGGETWNKVSNGFPQGDLGRIVVAINTAKPSEMLTIVEAKNPGLYLSKDEGNSFEKLAATENITARPFYFSTLVYDPSDAKRVYRPAFDFQFSKDGGYSWTSGINPGVTPHADHHALWINPQNPSNIYLGTDGGVYVSMNKGVSWQFLNNLPVGQFYHVSTDNDPTYNVYGGLQDNGSWMAPNTAPGGVSASNWAQVGGGDGFWVQTSPLNNKIVFSESQGGNATRLDRNTGLQLSIKPQLNAGEETHRFHWNTPLVTGIAPNGPDGKKRYALYMANQYLYRSTDEGRNWQRISPDLTTNNKAKQKSEESGGITSDNTSAENHCTIFTITPHPKNDRVIWVGTDDGNLQYTADGGKTWTNKASAVWAAGIPQGSWVSCIELSASNPDKVIYATFDNHMYGDHATYAAMSSDGGTTWKRFRSTEFTGFAHVLREDPVNPKLLFLGTEMGLFFSIDGGGSWMRSKYQGIPWYCLVRDIRIEPRTADLVLATHGRGIYIIDNLASLRNVVSSDMSRDATLFPPAEFRYDFAPDLPITGNENINGWVGASRGVAPEIQYWLKEPTKGLPKIEIYDAAGKKIKDINGTSLKGLNKVYWPLNTNPPKVAKGGFVAGSTVLYSAAVSPRVTPGNYKVVLRTDSQSFSQPIRILPNDAKGFSASALERMNRQGMRLFEVHEKLHGLVDSMDNTLAALRKLGGTDAGRQKKISDLDSMRREILELKRQTVFFDEFKYRRRLSDLYVEVVTSLEPLSPGKEEAITLMEKEYAEIERKVYAIMKR